MTIKLSKQRIDKLMVLKGFAKSREQANSILMTGNVFADNKRVEKPGQQVTQNSKIEIKGKSYPWVSRGGIKLNKAILEFNLDCESIIALDIGASTGGFTDVLLANGASKIYAVDVGYGQLDWKLRQDERVIVKEKTNARYLTDQIIQDPLDALVCDASFISLKKVLPSGLGLLKYQFLDISGVFFYNDLVILQTHNELDPILGQLKIFFSYLKKNLSLSLKI